MGLNVIKKHMIYHHKETYQSFDYLNLLMILDNLSSRIYYLLSNLLTNGLNKSLYSKKRKSFGYVSYSRYGP